MCHIRYDKELSKIENYISSKCGETEIIKSNCGHSTLINYILVATEGLKRAFSKREVNVWDVVQSAYIVEKVGASVVYEYGTSIFPLDISRMKFKDNKLILPFNIAGNLNIKEELKWLKK